MSSIPDRSGRVEHDGQDSEPTPASAAVQHLVEVLAQTWEYGRYWLSAGWDRRSARLRKLAILGAAGALGLVAGAGFVVTCIVLLLAGLARGVTILAGGRDWVGSLSVGLAGLLAVALGGWFVLRAMERGHRRRIRSRYEARQRHQRMAFGRDVTQAAARRDRHEARAAAESAGAAHG